MSSNVPVKPVIKWAGGKTQIIDSVLSLFPTTIQNYHEPFLGGSSVLLALLSNPRIQVQGQIYASDINPALIGLYTNIQSNVDAFIQEIRRLTENFSLCQEELQREHYYYQLRNQFNECTSRDSIPASAMFLFLNKTCFRGLYREGPKGFNVPYGHNKNPSIFNEDHIRTVSALIQRVQFSCRSFESSLQVVIRGDFVYLDPPYAPINETSFVGYTADGFDIERHRFLFVLCDSMTISGIRFVLSNADVPMVRDAFTPENYLTRIISCKRRINAKSPDSKADELLITNIYKFEQPDAHCTFSA